MLSRRQRTFPANTDPPMTDQLLKMEYTLGENTQKVSSLEMSVTWTQILIIVALASLVSFILGIFVYQFLDPALARSRTNKNDITSLNQDLQETNNIVNSHSTFIDNTVNDPPVIFTVVANDSAGVLITENVTTLDNKAESENTYSNSALLYDATTSCIIGPGIKVNDTLVIKIELVGTSSTLLTVQTQLVHCNLSAIENQANRGGVGLATGSEQSYITDFFLQVTQDIIDGGGLALNASSSSGTSFNLTHLHYLIFRHRPLESV